MALILPSGPSWAYCTHNLPSTPDASALGTSCTSGTSNADGSAVTMLAALAHDVEYLRLLISATVTTGSSNDALMSVLIDPAGGTSWSSFIPNLIVGGIGDTTTSGTSPASCGGAYDFPVWIPAGASLGLQARANDTAAITLKVAAFAYGGNANPASWWCGQRVTAIGINAPSSTGQAHTAGNSGSFSSWTNLGSALPAACGALQWGVNGEGDFQWATVTYQFEFGVGGDRIGAPLFRAIDSNEAGWWVPTGPIFRKLPSGAQLQVRGKASGTAQSLGVAAYAVY